MMQSASAPRPGSPDAMIPIRKSVRAETRAHDFDEMIVALGCQGGARLARGLYLDPIHQLRRRKGQRLVIFDTREAAVPICNGRLSRSRFELGTCHHQRKCTRAGKTPAGL